MVLAAIDIGSNAARLLIVEVDNSSKKNLKFNKLNLVRIPLRLGFDVFEKGAISGRKRKMLIDTIKAFKILMKVYEVDHYIACGTSAMRDADNSREIIKEIKNEISIDLDVISGDLEAAIIYETHISSNSERNESYLMIDVGGGSTEITLYHNSIVDFQHSYNIGTVRLLTDKVKDSEWDELEHDLKEIAKAHPDIIAVGSGGNINKLLSISKSEEKISLDTIRYYYGELKKSSIEERMERFKLKRDRADVIEPALSIYLNVLKWSGINEIQVPKVGLVDGLIQHLYTSLISD